MMRARAKDGGMLPNPRMISELLKSLNTVSRNTKKLNFFFVIFGQLVDHDMTLVPVAEGMLPAKMVIYFYIWLQKS